MKAFDITLAKYMVKHIIVTIKNRRTAGHLNYRVALLLKIIMPMKDFCTK